MSTLLHPSIDCHAGAVAATQFNYDAADDSQRRRNIVSTIKSEDDVLNGSKRRKLQANASDIQRNFEIAAWAVRKHLDFVCAFKFSSNNAEAVMSAEATAGQRNEQAAQSMLDQDVEGIVREASAAERCDAAGRHDLDALLRLTEARATVAGDHALIDISDGTMQSIESDRIRSSNETRGRNGTVHGVHIDRRGRAIAYAVHSRTSSGGYKFERWVPARNLHLRGYFERSDQVRGISPMAPSLNRLRDVYEGFDYALAKAKISQIFGIKVQRNAEDSLGNVDNDGDSDRPDYSVDLGAGAFMLDMEPGDDASIIESTTPSTQFQTYSEMMIAIALLSLDLPWNFYKVDATNFFGSRAALNLYLKSVKPKRSANRTLLSRWTLRQLQLAILQGRLRLPRSMNLKTLRWAWTPEGLPWWNPSQEADGALKSIGAALDNPQRICLETGTNFFENVDRIAEAQNYAETKGVTLSFGVSPGLTIQQDSN